MKTKYNMKLRNPRPLFLLLILVSGFAMIYLNAQSVPVDLPQSVVSLPAAENSELILPDVGFVKALIQKIGGLF